MRLIVFVRGSELRRWSEASAGELVVRKATTWEEASSSVHIDAGLVPFHLAERLGLEPDREQASVASNRGSFGPRWWITSPRLPPDVTRDPGRAIEYVVLEALFAAAVHDEVADSQSSIDSIALMGSDLGEGSALSIAARARRILDGLHTYHDLFGSDS